VSLRYRADADARAVPAADTFRATLRYVNSCCCGLDATSKSLCKTAALAIFRDSQCLSNRKSVSLKFSSDTSTALSSRSSVASSLAAEVVLAHKGGYKRDLRKDCRSLSPLIIPYRPRNVQTPKVHTFFRTAGAPAWICPICVILSRLSLPFSSAQNLEHSALKRGWEFSAGLGSFRKKTFGRW
jgi:hypothetical protein